MDGQRDLSSCVAIDDSVIVWVLELIVRTMIRVGRIGRVVLVIVRITWIVLMVGHFLSERENPFDLRALR